MEINHQINLPAEAWNKLCKNLSHFDEEHQSRIDKFFEEISETISISHNLNQIIVETSEIDENAILSILFGDSNISETTPRVNNTEIEIVSPLVSSYELENFANRDAKDSVYPIHLLDFETQTKYITAGIIIHSTTAA